MRAATISLKVQLIFHKSMHAAEEEAITAAACESQSIDGALEFSNSFLFAVIQIHDCHLQRLSPLAAYTV